MTGVYLLLLRLYPFDYRARFAAEMAHAFQSAARTGRVRFLLTEYAGLLAGVAAEWAAKWTTDPSLRGRCLPDIRMMRPPGVPREVWYAAPCGSPDPHSQDRPCS